MPAAIRIDRMVLDLPGQSAEAMRRIAALVAAELAGAGGLPAMGEMPRLSVTLPATPPRGEAALARLIAAGVLRDLARGG